MGRERGGEEAVDAVLVTLAARPRRPVALLALVTSMLLVAGMTAAVPMIGESGDSAVGLEPGEQRDAVVEAQGRVAGPPREPSTTSSTVSPRPDVPGIGAASPEPVEPTGTRSRSSSASSSSTTTTSTRLPPTTTTTTAASPAWQRTADAPFAGRSGHEALTTPSGHLVLGGTGEGALTGAVYDSTNDTWRETAAAPEPFGEGDWRDARLGAAWTGSTVFVASRDGGAASYDPASDTWTSLPSLPAGVERPGGVVVWTGSTALVWGGDAEGAVRRVGLSYDLSEGGGWTRLADAPFPVGEAADAFVHAVWTGDALLVWDDSARGWAYDPASDAWSAQLAPAPAESPLDGATVAWTGSEAVWLFGETPDGSHPALALAYDPEADEWTALAQPPVGGRHRPTSVVLGDGRVFVCCGATAGAGTRAAVFDPGAGSWTTTSASDDLPLHGAGATVTRIGPKVLVWGGEGSGASGLTWTP